MWRGPLDSCNYGCVYCPFAKRPVRADNLATDARALARFVEWIEHARGWRFELLFTPWGEALIHRAYQDAMVRLSRCDAVASVAIQTNGSSSRSWLKEAGRDRVTLWMSWHPTEVALDRFVKRAEQWLAGGALLSVGAVAVPSQLAAIEALRAALPASVPMWLNAQRPGVRYAEDLTARCLAIDPHFLLERRPHETRGAECATGQEAIAVDGHGTITRCHFIETPLGNLYKDELDALLTPRPCTRARCECYIGYAHLARLDFRSVFGDGLLARRRLPIARDGGPDRA